MTQRTSLVGGIIAFSAVILLSCLTQNLVGGNGLFHQKLLPAVEDSVDVFEGPDTLDPQGQPTLKAMERPMITT
ncbi:MAG: hypothetical protein ABIF09_02650, partial [Gemmatimonadota bacterium]